MKSTPFPLSPLPFLAILLLSAPSLAATYTAHPANLPKDIHPGDTLILPNGTYTNCTLTLPTPGTPDHPITLRAQTPGKVVLTGNSTITLNADYQTLDGILLQNGGAKDPANSPTDGISLTGSHCHLTNSAIIGGTYKFLCHLRGTDETVDHCFFAGKTSGEPTFQIEADHPNHDHVFLNHFGWREPLGRNGGETIRVGYSGQSMLVSASLVEQNLFDRCSGEIEIISSKSCENIYRDNTFLDCGGMLTLRHGNRCTVDGNFFFAHHVHGSGGIRVIGEDHLITNNYIEGVEKGAFWITTGVQDSQLNQYFAAKRATIAFNTVVDCKGPVFDLDAGMGGNHRTLFPQDITILNNLLAIPQGGTLFAGQEGKNYKFLGNLVAPFDPAAPATFPTHPGVIAVTNLHLERGAGNLFRPTQDSPAIAAAAGNFPIKTDIDGQFRPTPPHYPTVGCDEPVMVPTFRRPGPAPFMPHPLTAAEVGPPWLTEKDRQPPKNSVLNNPFQRPPKGTTEEDQ